MPGYGLQGREKRPAYERFPQALIEVNSDSICLFLHKKKVDRYSLKRHVTFVNARGKDAISE